MEKRGVSILASESRSSGVLGGTYKPRYSDIAHLSFALRVVPAACSRVALLSSLHAAARSMEKAFV